MTLLDQFVERARSSPKNIVLAEGTDLRVLTAAVQASRQGIAQITLLGNELQIKEACHKNALEIDGIKTVDPDKFTDSATYAKELFCLREHKGMTEREAETAISDPLILSNILTRTGVCDGSVAGAVYPTSDVVRTALQLIGKKAGYDLVSSFFIMVFDRPVDPSLKVMVFADCALIIDPNAMELAHIAIVSADSAQNFVRLSPQIALLSFSTDGSADHELVDKVIKARQLVSELRPDLNVVGDIQLDAAILPDILHRKSKAMRLERPANVLIFPNLDAGNIGYKLVERFAGAQAIGPILQGLNKPANDLSRGCSVDDIVKIITVTVLQAQSTPLLQPQNPAKVNESDSDRP